MNANPGDEEQPPAREPAGSDTNPAQPWAGINPPPAEPRADLNAPTAAYPAAAYRPPDPELDREVDPGYGGPDWKPPASAFFPPPDERSRRSLLWRGRLPWIAGGVVAILLLAAGITAAVLATAPTRKRTVAAASPPPASPAAPSPTAAPTSGPPSPAPTSSAPSTPPATVPTTPLAASSGPPVIGDGTWSVPGDLARATYHTTVPADSRGCYWERSANASADRESILANDNLPAGAHAIVTIGRADRAFETTGCGTWKPAPAEGTGATTFGDGMWAVGVDVAPGTYTATPPDTATGCYWALVRDFLGENSSIVANENVATGARATVTIAASVKGVYSSNCGTWKRR